MGSAILKWTAVILTLHIVLKPVVFCLPYKHRRIGLDKSYHNKACATETLDNVMLVVAAAVGTVVLAGDSDLPSFICGAWIGATLIQGFFHRFNVQLGEATRPPPGPQSPIKMMSYAIQAAPEKGWRELVLLGGLSGVALAMHVFL